MFAYMIREAIKERMRELNISQAKLVQELGLNKGNLSSFISGKRPLPLSDIERICKVLSLELKPSN